MQPINNIYWVPIEEISFQACSDGSTIQGGHFTKTLVEADSPGEARIALRQLLNFADNYNDLSVEKRRRLKPFRLAEGEIEKVLECGRRFKNNRGDYTCGKPVNEYGEYDPSGINGEFGGCCIDGFDFPDGDLCPYVRQRYVKTFT